MKLHLPLFFLFFFSVTSCKASYNDAMLFGSTSDTLKIMTWNIRIDISADTGTCSWDYRKNEVPKIINRYKPDIAGIQEILNLNQQNDFIKKLPSYSIFAFGRDNQTGSKGERLAIIFNKTRFNILNKGFFFLSETPGTVSKGWDAALNRICIWLQLSDKITGKTFFVFNTHFDHIGKTARIESARLILKKANEIAGEFPVLCMGDLNTSPTESAVYTTFTSEFTDSKNLTKGIPGGTNGTFNGWNFKNTDFDESVRIDYIFLKKIIALSHLTINDKTEKLSYPSDHFPVFCSCIFKD